MKKVLYIYGGPEFHPTQAAGIILKEILKNDGRFEMDETTDLDAFVSLPGGKYDVVVDFTTGFVNDLTSAREQGLLNFIKNGGGFVGIHSAADSFRGSRAYIDMLGSEFMHHPAFHEFKVSIVDGNHYMTTRVKDFLIEDEMYFLQSYDESKVRLLAQTPWKGVQMPMAYVKEYGKGRVAYIANGHDLRAWNNPEFRKILVRAISWSTGAEKPDREIRFGLLGYGPAFGMGKFHAETINRFEGLKTVAVCDASQERLEAARKEVQGVEGYFTSLDDMLRMDNLDAVVNILPHNLHASMALKCIEAGKHTIVEKPFCINVEEANSMIELAKEKRVMLSVFNCRRWDHDYLTIKDIIKRELIGDIFHIEYFTGGYEHPGFWWRSDKKISGGVIYDWGAHSMDWILNLIPSKIKQVTGDLQKRVWNAVTNEDHAQAHIRFENGVTVDFMITKIAAAIKPKWYILGTKGSIVSDWGDEVKLTSYVSGIQQDSIVKIKKCGDWAEYYRNIADHLIMGEELIVKPEQARRVIGVFEAMERSSESGVSVAPPVGCE